MEKKRAKKIQFNKSMKLRAAIVFVGVILLLVLLNIRLYYLNQVKGDDYSIRVLNQQQYSSTILPFKRGDITDANGNLLATSVKVYNLILDPYIMYSDEDYLEPTVATLVQCFELDETELRTTLESRKESRYVVSIKKLSYDAIKEFLAMQDENDNIKGVWFEEEYERKYPYSTLASDVIGFVYSGNYAEWGLEGSYNDVLNGTDGRKYGYMNQDNVQESVTIAPTNGYNLVTTIDLNIQTIVEKHIADWVEQYNPLNVAVVIQHPNNGEILAMASKTNYDLNNPRDLSGYYTEEEIAAMSAEEQLTALNEIWRNFCVSDIYEPGSTAKPLTVASALEEGLVTENSTFTCDRGEKIGGWTIRCTKEHGLITLAELLMYSCNDATMAIAAREGKDIFTDYQTRFNLGLKTGIDLPGEGSGLTYSANDMDSTTLATNSFGQNFNVTMVQMTSAFSSVINGGNYYEPHLVKQITNENGNTVTSIDQTLVKKTVTEETSRFIKAALARTVIDGTGKAAAVDGYTVGGKTGTAQKSDKTEAVYILSFLGFAPVDDPQVVCYVIVDEPDVENNDSSSYASRLWSNIMTEVLPYMNILE